MSATTALSRAHDWCRARSGTIFVSLVVAHLLLKLVLLPWVAPAPLHGDEVAYADAGRALSNLIRDLVALRSPDSAELERNVVGSAWFMPGMGVLLTPLFLVAPDASLFVIRCYLGVLSSTALVAVAAHARRRLGAGFGIALLVFPGLTPMWLLFSFGAWGDLLAGLLAVVLIIRVLETFRSLRSHEALTWRAGAELGALAIAVVYLRSSAVLLVAGMLVVVGIATLLMLRGRTRLRGVGALAVTGLVFLAILLPWSIAASQSLGSRVMTTSTVPAALANSFGDPAEFCYGPCDPGSTKWFSPVRYARELARATDSTEVESLEHMSVHARRDITRHSYAEDVLANLDAYLGQPEQFTAYLSGPDVRDDDPRNNAIGTWTRLMFYPALAVGALVLLLAWRRPFEDQVLALLLKLGIGALLAQPFVHLSGGRYWTTLAPFLALSAALVVRHGRHRRLRTDDVDPTQQWLHRLHVMLSVGVLVVAATVVVLAQ